MQNEARKLAELGPHGAFDSDTVTRISERLLWAKKVCADSWETLDHTGGSSGNDNNSTRNLPSRSDARNINGRSISAKHIMGSVNNNCLLLTASLSFALIVFFTGSRYNRH